MENCAYLRKNPGYAPEYLWYENSTIAETWQEHFLINGDSKDVKTLGNGNIFQSKFFVKKVKKAPFCDVTRNVNTSHTLVHRFSRVNHTLL